MRLASSPTGGFRIFQRRGKQQVELNHYSLFGLNAVSEIALPELWPGDPQASPDVVVRFGPVPCEDEPKHGLVVLSEGEALLVVPGVGRYLMRAGREMIVEADAGSSERNLRLYLLGSAFAALLHQRGLLPLHANAIIVDGRVIAFMGHPGAGKSTMAAWFHDRGFGILSD